MPLFASQFGLREGPDLLAALAHPIVLAGDIVVAGPPWPLLLLVMLALVMVWAPDRKRRPARTT